MAEEILSPEPVSLDLVETALELLRHQGADINPYSLALELDLELPKIVQDRRIMELLYKFRGEDSFLAAENEKLAKRVEELEAELAEQKEKFKPEENEAEQKKDKARERDQQTQEKEDHFSKNELEIERIQELETLNSELESKVSGLTNEVQELMSLHLEAEKKAKAGEEAASINQILKQDLAELKAANQKYAEQVKALESANQMLALSMQDSIKQDFGTTERAFQQAYSEGFSAGKAEALLLLEESKSESWQMGYAAAQYELQQGQSYSSQTDTSGYEQTAYETYGDTASDTTTELTDAVESSLEQQQGYAEPSYAEPNYQTQSSEEYEDADIQDQEYEKYPEYIDEQSGEHLIMSDPINESDLSLVDPVYTGESLAPESSAESNTWTEDDSQVVTQDYVLPSYMNSSLFDESEASQQQANEQTVSQDGYEQSNHDQSAYDQSAYDQSAYDQSAYDQSLNATQGTAGFAASFQTGDSLSDDTRAPAGFASDAESLAGAGGFGDPRNMSEYATEAEDPESEDIESSLDRHIAGDSSEPKKSSESEKKKKTAFNPDELRDLVQQRIHKQEEVQSSKDEGDANSDKLTLKKFVGGKHTGQETNPANMPRMVSPDVRRACKLLGLRPEELSRQAVLDAWKREFSKPGVHPDTGGDTEMAMYLNNAKDTLVRYLDAQAPKLGKVFGAKAGEQGKNNPKGDKS